MNKQKAQGRDSSLVNSNHTPGPWKYNKHRHAIIGANGDNIISTYGDMGGDNVNADIALISAAPELLVELKKAIAEYEHASDIPGISISCGSACEKCQAEKLIAKATGRG